MVDILLLVLDLFFLTPVLSDGTQSPVTEKP